MASKTKTEVVLENVEEMADMAAAETNEAADTVSVETTKAAKKVKAKAKDVEPVAEQVEVQVEEAKTEVVKVARVRVPKPVRQVYLAGLGAVSMAQDETGALFHKLVDQGTMVQQQGRKLVGHASRTTSAQTAKATELVKNGMTVATEPIEVTVERVLTKLNVPTKSDIERLSEKITELSHKVDELKATNGHKPSA